MKSKAIIFGVVVVMIVLGFFVVSFIQASDDRRNTDDYEDAPVSLLSLECDGKTYTYRDGITTYLIMGTDETLASSDSGLTSERAPAGSALNNRQADYLMLVFVDRRNKTYTGLQLNRETVSDVPVLDEKGLTTGTFHTHLDNAYSFGSGGKDSCRNTAAAVSSLLFGIPVDHYLALTMDGVPVMADLVGGVPVTVENDLTSVDPAFEEGVTVTLRGDQALRFVRARRGVTGGQNVRRMSRQKAFMFSLYNRMTACMNNSGGFALKFAEAMEPYITSDLITEEFANFANQLMDYTFRGIEDTKGSTVVDYKTGFNDYFMNEKELKLQIVRLCFW